MVLNKHSLNLPKTEYIIIATPQQWAKHVQHVMEVEDTHTVPSNEVRNLGVIFDEWLSYNTHVAHISKLAYH